MGNHRKMSPFHSQNELTMPSVVVSVEFCDSDAFITINVPKCRGLWPAFMLLLQRNNFEVVNATLSNSGNTSFHCIHAQIPDESDIDSEDLQSRFEALIVEELSIQASTPNLL